VNAAAQGERLELLRRLAEAEATVQALLSGEIDAVVDARTSTPLLLAKAQGALRESEERARLLLDSTGQGIYGLDLESRCTLANAACLRMLGYESERDLLGRSMHEIIHHTRADGSHYPVAECRVSNAGLRTEGALLDDEVLWRSDGSHFPAEMRSFPMWRDGVRVGAVVSFSDTGARRKAEETLRWLAAIVETSWDAIAGIDPAGVVTTWNPGAERLYGYTAAEMLGQPISILRPSGRAGPAIGIGPGVLDGSVIVRDLDIVCVRKDGSAVEVSVSLSVIRDASGKALGVSGVSRDITRRRAAEQQLRLLNDVVLAAGKPDTLAATLGVVLRLICEATGVAVATAWAPAGSGTLEPCAQWTAPAAGLQALREDLALEEGDTLPRRVLESRAPASITDLAGEPGSRRARIATELGLLAALAVPILAGEELVAILEVLVPSAERIPGLTALLSAVSTQLGSVLQRRRAEEALRKAEAQFLQAQKMEAIGQLTGGVAHDFNNLLSVILSYSSTLADDMSAEDPRREDLLEIKKAGDRAAALTRQLLAFSRQQVLQPRVIDLNQSVSGLEKMLRRLLGEDLEFTVIPSAEPARVFVDPGQMDQVLMNLAVNARDAMPSGGKLTIELRHVELDTAFALTHAGVTAGPHLLLRVSDNGGGMDAATQARAFEPFFTTKEQGKGTGLGLSTVFGIVRQSAGTVWLDSAPGHGTTFRIYLPVAGPGEGKPVPAPVGPARLRGAETVLVVEDEENVRKLVRSILQRNGYRVIEAGSGSDAVRIAGEQGKIDLLLTDVVMPRMGGAETAALLRSVRPGLKLLYMSGYTDDAVVLHGVRHAEAFFMQKPFTPLTLLSKVREALDSA
jgi:two-component system cell cycle sensor histidine kinase/response regulator CckA